MSNNVILKQGTCEMCNLVKPALKFEIVDQEQLIICSDCSNIVEVSRATSDTNAKQEAKTGYIVEIAEVGVENFNWGFYYDRALQYLLNGSVIKKISIVSGLSQAMFGVYHYLDIARISGFYISSVTIHSLSLYGAYAPNYYDIDNPTEDYISLGSTPIFKLPYTDVPADIVLPKNITAHYTEEDDVSLVSLQFGAEEVTSYDLYDFVYSAVYTPIGE